MGWIILAAILLLLALFLRSSVVLTVSCENGEFQLTLGYLFLRHPITLTQTEKPKETAVSSGGKKAAPGREKKEEKRSLSQSVSLVWDWVKASVGELGVLLSKLRLSHLRLQVRIWGEDAADTGIEYGKTCAYVYSGLAALQGLISVRQTEEIQITPVFSQGHAPTTAGADYFFSFRLKLRIGSLLLGGLGILWRYWRIINKKEEGVPGTSPSR